mgnify:CR=1 FL=1
MSEENWSSDAGKWTEEQWKESVSSMRETFSISWKEIAETLMREVAPNNQIRSYCTRTDFKAQFPEGTNLSGEMYAWFRRQEDKCATEDCENVLGLQIEHITEVSDGGTDHPDNLQLMCRGCNIKKNLKKKTLVRGSYIDAPLTNSAMAVWLLLANHSKGPLTYKDFRKLFNLVRPGSAGNFSIPIRIWARRNGLMEEE